MNKRLIGVLVFAFVVSAGASLILYRLISSTLNKQTAQPSGSRIVAAARHLPIGTLIKDLDIKMVDWQGSVSPNAVLKPEDAVGRGVIADIYEGESLLESRLASRGAGGGMAATIPQGMRAMAIRVNDVTSVGGFVIPGMRVDIIIMGTPPGAASGLGTQTKTLLQNVEVLSAGQQIQRDAEGKPVSVPVVNMLVTPEQAEILSLAINGASIQLVLRNPLDKKESKTEGTAMAQLWTGQRLIQPVASVRPAERPIARKVVPPPPPVVEVKLKEKPAALVVEVLHGARKAEVKFDIPEGKESSEGKN